MTNEEQIRIQLIIDYKECFATEHGKHTLEDLSKFCCEKKQTFNEDNQYMTAFNEGARAVIRYIRKKVDADMSETKQKEAIHETKL